ncbi:hypothetical protein AB0P12_23765 [Streptomyces subrutilus]|uniref:hypothetical protein n=1 Tax=Streptomyces subrutilus TaxID=36818 RepID=UPI0033DB0AB9
MAEENGTGVFGAGPSGGLADAIRAQADAQSRAAALRIEHDSLTEYKGMVDALLEELSGSDADHKKLADGTLTQAALGHGFPEADAIFASYSTVITELEGLSKGLAGQIEGLGIAVLSAGNGFADVDEETRRRMAAIAKEARAQYVPERDPYVEEQRTSAAGGTV